jgi:hydrogenase maturation protease
VPLTARVLLIGYGNPGRGDDGLGPALAETIEALALPGLTVDIDYQLTVDHAARIAAHDLVVFADAMIGLATPFRFSEIARTAPETLGSHQVSPEAALALAEMLFGHAPPGWVLAIAGKAFGEVHEGLSQTAQTNLAQAVEFLTEWLAQRQS